MKFKFESNLKFQLDAISSVTDLFVGAPFIKPEEAIFSEVASNVLKISPEEVFANRDKVIKNNGITNSCKEEVLDFCVEMETGTGKTYVYVRTILELHQKYGLSKFIIVVPSVAVKEGVMKTLQITKDHFEELYNSIPYSYFEYDSKKINKVRSFVYSNHLQIMIMNVQAFNADDRIINQERDSNNGEKLIDLIEKVSPVLILDEPQVGMDTSNTKVRRKKLNPLFTLRYSATHKVVKNLIHRLSPYEAYNQGLVKKIEVFSIHESNTQSNVYVEFEGIKLTSDKPQAKLKISYRLASGDFKVKSGYFKDGDDLEEKTKNPVYKGWVIERILKDPLNGTSTIKFSNGTNLTRGESHGTDKESIFREQIRWTIKKHFDKKDKYKDKKIKVLSLFFIDRVANYIEDNSLIRGLFEKVYTEEYKNRYKILPDNISKVHDGYFARTSQGDYTDSELSMSKNSEAYQKILKDKERLLSFEEPLEFIFSHSALGVGWDNPNVFNICTLNETESLIKKRQEIGRGLRLSVTQEGVRYRDSIDVEEGKEVNLLTVVANQSYYAFTQSYQEELIAEYGFGEKKPDIRNARHEPKQIRLNKNAITSNDFQNLWKKISQKTKCKVFFREDSIIEKCIESLNTIVVPEVVISINLNRITEILEQEEDMIQSKNVGQTEAETKAKFAPINLFEEIAKNTALSVATATKILEGVDNKQMIIRNPVVYLTEAIKRIKRVLNDEMVRLVRYEALNESYSLKEFEDVVTTYQQSNIIEVNKGIYDHVVCDSDIERNFALDIDEENKVRVFVKLPHWYTVPTPIGNYNPDFALVLEKKNLDDGGKSNFYFVIETKGSREWESLKEDEKMKIDCAIKHFEAIGLKEYLAPIESVSTFKSKANEVTGENVFS